MCRLSRIISIHFFFFSSRRRHTRCLSDWSSDVCSPDLTPLALLDPLDARSLQVGTDLLGVMTVAITSPTGTANYSLALRSEERRVGKECRSRWSPCH